jgi:chemotaxis signal transduction protein
METSVYKNVEIPRELFRLIPHMGDVEGYRDELNTLVSQWDLLTILGQMAGTDSDMTSTRKEFQSLTNDLLGHLGLETLKKSVQEVGAVAQVAVDILIRNLFERTADIGFLATDDDLRAFAKQSKKGAGSDDAKRELIKRFKEYVAKYSVYHNIILLDVNGNVLAQLDEESSVVSSKDPLIQESLMTSGEYVEVFRYTDLDPSQKRSLIYAYRVTESNDSHSEALGVLCLCFRFENEMEGIFSNLMSEDNWSVITILDDDGRVIASSDPYQIPCEAKVERVLRDDYKLIKFSGNEYLAKTCATKGYQGFMGLGWQGHVMLPLSHAFASSKNGDLADRVEPKVLDAVMKDPQLFSEELRRIPLTADAIQKDLNRTVWNGNVHETTQQSKVLLWNISASGEKTKQVFQASIGNLHQTVISAILEDATFQAALAVDIMDRNLYERANDCRWWALTSSFRSILAQGEVSAADQETMGAILKYINDLYTVYTNLFVYDTTGRVVAVSNPAERKLIGQTLKTEWVAETLQLKDTQAYSVSAFEKTMLYGDKHTYVYGASIQAPGSSNQIVGGIGIVFDSEPQFEAMLEDSLPRDEHGNPLDGVFAVFCDRHLKVISSSNGDIQVGKVLNVDIDLTAAGSSGGDSKIIPYKGQYYAVGARMSSGYREYKRSDNYTNDVIALIFSPLAQVEDETESKGIDYKTPNLEFKVAVGEKTIDVATFRIKESTYGLRTESIHKAIDIDGITSIPGCHPLMLGKIVDEKHAIPVVDFEQLYTGEISTIDKAAQLLIIKGAKGHMAIVVDELGPIPAIPERQIDFNATLLDFADHFTEGVLMPENASSHSEMVVLLDASRLQEHLVAQGSFDKNDHPGSALAVDEESEC